VVAKHMTALADDLERCAQPEPAEHMLDYTFADGPVARCGVKRAGDPGFSATSDPALVTCRACLGTLPSADGAPPP
jgi:hypothetical protein